MKKTLPLLVHLKKDSKASAAAASFAETIVDCLRNAENAGGDAANEIYVNCEMTGDALVLTGFQQNSNTSKKYLLRRPPFCPIKSLTDGGSDLPEETRTRGVNIGVAVLLMSSDNNVLLTRRAKKMRTFPHVWVPPGGHVEHGESLFEAGRRELQEETGITVEDEDNSTSILGLWESAYPPMSHLGLPKRHHIVVYLHHKAKDTATNITRTIKLQSDEVDACAWICGGLAERIVSTDPQFGIQNSVQSSTEQLGLCAKQQEYVGGILIGDDQKPVKGEVIPTAPLFAGVGKTHDNERVSTGTKYALRLWLNSLRKPRIFGESQVF